MRTHLLRLSRVAAEHHALRLQPTPEGQHGVHVHVWYVEPAPATHGTRPPVRCMIYSHRPAAVDRGTKQAPTDRGERPRPHTALAEAAATAAAPVV